MKKTFNIDIDNLDALCRLYLDGRLARAQEAELELLLVSAPDATSPAIDEALETMEVERLFRPQQPARRRRRPWVWIASVAAAAALFVTLGPGIIMHEPATAPASAVYVAAYDAGVRLDSRRAARAVERSVERADSLMEMAAAIDRLNARMSSPMIYTTVKTK